MGLFDQQPMSTPPIQNNMNYPQRNDAFMFPNLSVPSQQPTPEQQQIDALNAQQQQATQQQLPWHPIVDQYMKQFLGIGQ